MTDKSFGDFHNKNTIKNPLLSSAVTGLSLDELTHKAVLLPVSSIQEQNARSEQQGTQSDTLRHLHHDQPNPAGDAFPNIQITSQTIPSTIKPNTNSQKALKTEYQVKSSSATQSKASAKSDDDFDVNEYIARLQGTRYVSAPLHSHLKEDNNANMAAAEENLEEINLNDSQNVEVQQQSLTADLAQNFSQLPTVLPHVASAVFSSFSNMLNLRSRDQTPDDKVQDLKPGCQEQASYQEKSGGFQGQVLQGNATAPLMVEDKPPKELAPPPREPPVKTGPSNFRLPPKKKYAQIPGLSTGEARPLPYSSQTQPIPSFFTPGQTAIGGSEMENRKNSVSEPQIQASFFAPGQVAVGVSEIESRNSEVQSSQMQAMPSFSTPGQTVFGVSETENKRNEVSSSQIQAIPSFFTPGETSIGVNEMESRKNEVPASQIQAPPSFFTPSQTVVGVSEMESRKNESLSSQIQGIPSFFIPGQMTVGGNDIENKEGEVSASQIQAIPSVFTPGQVAVRMSKMDSRNEVLSSQTQTIPSFFTPGQMAVGASEIANQKHEAQTSNMPPLFIPGQVSAGVNETENRTNVIHEIQASLIPSLFTPSAVTTGATASESNPKLYDVDRKTDIISSAPVADAQAPIIPPPPMFSNFRRDRNTILPPSVARRITAYQNMPNPSLPRPEPMVPTLGLNKEQDNLNQSTVFPRQESLLQREASGTVLDGTMPHTTSVPRWPMPPPNFEPAIFDPSVGSKDQPPSVQGSVLAPPPIVPQPSNMNPPQNEPPKTLIEPPKATGPVSFRMTNKRPQYYVGPIEGLAPINNQAQSTAQVSNMDSIQPALFSVPFGETAHSADLSAIPNIRPEIPRSSDLFNPGIQPNLYNPNDIRPIDQPPVQGSESGLPIFPPSPFKNQESTVSSQAISLPPDTASQPIQPSTFTAEPRSNLAELPIEPSQPLSSIYLQRNEPPITSNEPSKIICAIADVGLINQAKPTTAALLSASFGKPPQSEGISAIISDRPQIPPSSNLFAPEIQPNMFNPSGIRSTDQINAPPLQGSESHQPIFPPLSYQSQESTVPSQASSQLPNTSQPIQASTITTEIQSYFAPPPIGSSLPSSSINSPQNEGPKTLIEPPKATGAVSFRMINRRPQYYAGPIEGVGPISNQAHPATAQVLNTDPFNTALLPRVSTVSSYDRLQAAYIHSDELSQPQHNPSVITPQSTQDFNTPFDLSRLATAAYEEPKPQPKGFGIIGSLKSKLSSIDINKIQSTVTTFFDPAYNNNEMKETRKISTQDNAPSEQGQYSSDYDNNRNYQTNFPQLEEVPVVLSYNDNVYQNYTPMSQYINPPPPNYTPYSLEKQENKVKNETQTQNVNINTDIPTNIDDIENENVLLPQPDVITTLDPHFRDDASYTIDNTQFQVAQEHNYNTPATASRINTSQHAIDTSFHTAHTNQLGHVGSTLPTRPSAFFSCPPGFEPRDVNPDIIEDTLRQFPNTTSQTLIHANAAEVFDSNDDNIKIEEVPTLATLAPSLDDDEPEAIPSNYFNQRNEDFNLQAERIADTLTNLSVSDVTRDPAAEIGPNINAIRRQSAEALSVASTAPLFGLSAMIADRNREVEQIRPFDNARRHSLLGSNSSASFFENIPTSDDVKEKPVLSITDVRNVLLMEPPQEDICQVLKRNASSNLVQNPPEVSQANNAISAPSSFFDHPLRDIEHDENDLNICEICREVNTPEPQTIEEVTAQVVDDFSKEFVKMVELAYADSIATNVPLRETAIDEQLEEIRHIAEDTIETLQAQSAIELLDETPNPEYAAYSTAIQSCKYAFEDAPEPVVKSKFNYKLDPETEASLDYDAYYNSSTLFYQNRLPENASDDNKANYQESSQEDSDESDDKSEPGLDVHLIEQDATQDLEEYIIEPSETDDDKIEVRGRFRTRNPNDTFTNRVERFQKSVDAGGFSYNSPTSLASYFDTGNYAVEAHFRNSQTSPDVTNLTFPPGFEDEYDRRMSGYNGSPLAPQIPDCGTQTRSINTATFSSAHQRYNMKYSGNRTLQCYPTVLKAETDKPELLTRDTSESETAQFEPTAPELSVIEAESPDLSTNDGDSQGTENIEISEIQPEENEQVQPVTEIRTQDDNIGSETEKAAEVPISAIEQKTQEIRATEDLKPAENPIESYSTLSQLTTATLTQEIINTNLFVQEAAPNLPLEVTSTSNLFQPQIQNEMTLNETEFFKESDHSPLHTTNIGTKIQKADNSKLQEFETNKMYELTPERPEVFQNEEAKPDPAPIKSQLTNIFDPKPATTFEEPKSIMSTVESQSTNILDNAGASNNDQKIPKTNLFEEKRPKNTNIPPETLPDPMNFFSSKDESPKPESSDFNRLASYFSTPASQPDHSKSFFELSQSQNHYRHSSANTSQNNTRNDPVLTQNARQNLTNLMKDLTSTQNIPIQENITKTINYFTVEYDFKTDVKELANEESTKSNIPSKSKGDNLNINKDTDKKETSKDNHENSEINNKNLTELTNDETLTQIILNCKHCSVNTNQLKVRSCANDTEPTKETSPSDMDQKVTKKSNPSESDNMLKNEEVEDGVTVVVETRSSEYTPVRHHWFYRYEVEDKSVWRGFSVLDSNTLEEAFHRPDLNENTVVPTDGGRFDVNIVGRLRVAVYWKEKPTNVRRCSWFYKGTTDSRYVPYTEGVAEKLEEEYRHGIMTGEWHRRLVLPNNEVVIMHGPTVMVHFWQGTTDAFSTPAITLLGKRVYRNPPKIRVVKDQPLKIDHLVFFVHGAGEYKRKERNDDATSRPRVVRRGHEESEIEEASPTGMDHLLLLCHGVGSACDMRFRSVEEVVEDFRSTSLQLVQSHYKNSYDNGTVNRVEVLPISWHAQLHGGEAGVDRRLQRITLDSIPRLRAFTNHTVLDVLFYTSPVYHQTIIDTVCFELNRIYNLFKQRNPNFKGGISLGGHSLGSVILYDLLCNQIPNAKLDSKPSAEKTYLPDITSSEPIKYPVLQFEPDALYALGSPIAIFECIRGVETLGLDFRLPTCKNFFNIFHPYDPIAYRIEPLINPQLQDSKPFLIPHHKGRKRMHLELKDTMVRVGADLKQKLLESLRTTWNKWKSTPPTDGQLEKVVEEEMEKEQLCEDTKEENQENIEMSNPELLGRLNAGRRVDYVLQEAPLEMINEYLFAMSSHVGYWESEDTMLLMLREIYSSLGVQPDSTVPQQSMTVQRTRKLDEAMVVNEKDYPSTSRGGVS